MMWKNPLIGGKKPWIYIYIYFLLSTSNGNVRILLDFYMMKLVEYINALRWKTIIAFHQYKRVI